MWIIDTKQLFLFKVRLEQTPVYTQYRTGTSWKLHESNSPIYAKFLSWKVTQGIVERLLKQTGRVRSPKSTVKSTLKSARSNELITSEKKRIQRRWGQKNMEELCYVSGSTDGDTANRWVWNITKKVKNITKKLLIHRLIAFLRKELFLADLLNVKKTQPNSVVKKIFKEKKHF